MVRPSWNKVPEEADTILGHGACRGRYNTEACRGRYNTGPVPAEADIILKPAEADMILVDTYEPAEADTILVGHVQACRG